MARNEKDPSKLEDIGIYSISGPLKSFISRLQKIANKHPNAIIHYEMDYSGCYYESDSPEVLLRIRSK